MMGGSFLVGSGGFFDDFGVTIPEREAI